MRISQFCSSPAQTILPGAKIPEAAALMKTENVGCLVVIDENSRPVGMLTDRDIAINVGHHSPSIDQLAVADLMSPDPVTVSIDASIQHATALMRDSAHRRLPVTNQSGEVTGLLSADDLVIELSEELEDLADGLRKQVGLVEGETRSANRPRTTMHT